MTRPDPRQSSTWGTKLSDRETHFFEAGRAAGVAAERERLEGSVIWNGQIIPVTPSVDELSGEPIWVPAEEDR